MTVVGGQPRGRRLCAVLVTLVGTSFVPHAGAGADGPLVELVGAAARRLGLDEPVAAFEWKTGGAVEDPARVRQELDALGAQASVRNIDAGYVARIFGDQVNATEAIEYSRFAQWKLDPDSAPADATDLSASRSAIDALIETMPSQVVANWDVLHSPACAGRLDAARTDVARPLDGLYRQALSAATRSYCQR
ncbi:chorismate mutase [Mycobacterium servetii]|uniref:chorismate mutase n=1 Tax=Mycobacterium servetii TaxID=3237418 RepID=A0ABV4C1R9_9MYCO